MKKLLLSLALVAAGLFVTGCMTPDVTPEMQQKIETAQQTGKYQNYSEAAVAKVEGNNPYVVFFHAPWCGTCVNWEQKVVSNIDTLPANTKIFKADYDTQAKDFGVTYQSTALFFDASGNQTDSVTDPSLEVLTEFFELKGVVAEEQENTNTWNGITYIPYSKTERAKYDGKERYAIYFHATWCGTCKKYKQEIMQKQSTFAANTIFLEADFDTETDLRKELGVTTQTSFVVFDKTGEVQFKKIKPAFEELVAQFSDEKTVENITDNVINQSSVSNEEPVKEITTNSLTKESNFKYTDYSADERARYDGKEKYAIYFHATWCGTCTKYKQKIMENKSAFPEGSVILQADYDTETALKKEFGVTNQTTFVVISKDGSVVFKGVNPKFEDLVAQF